MFNRLMHFAGHALSYVWEGETLELQQGRAPGERPGRFTDTPDVQLVPGAGEWKFLFQVPGAGSKNTLVCWDEDVHTLCVRVTRAAADEHDLYAEVRLPANVAGAKSRCVLLKEGVLRVRAPEEDTPASTGLVLLERISEPAGLLFACEA